MAIFGMPALWGLLAVAFFIPSPGQMRAQIIGAVSILLLGFLPAVALQGVLAVWRRVRPGRARSSDWDESGLAPEESAMSSQETTAMG